MLPASAVWIFLVHLFVLYPTQARCDDAKKGIVSDNTRYQH